MIFIYNINIYIQCTFKNHAFTNKIMIHFSYVFTNKIMKMMILNCSITAFIIHFISSYDKYLYCPAS